MTRDREAADPTVGTYGDQARRALLDSAEELFATFGVDAVSNRRIAEHAGNANHSAVNYHFGSRDALVRATMMRYSDDAHRRRRELIEMLGPEPDLRDLLSCLVVPLTDQLASLPVPSWRARFLRQLRTVPSMIETVAASTTTDRDIAELIERARASVADLPETVISGRSWLLGHMVIDACAEYEERVDREHVEPDWTGFAYFLVDACAGMLAAPVTSAGDFLSSRAESTWA
ncbi:TetR/AcrR family transcriptional regulator [Rhodococcus coprophilus]|uniref:TetR/AcrR family transcriptional regulator n=1 Tax=Rhodococcus coprophilus TaxID=38310 RepID=UPI001D438263|nr:TetR/AcrR family transcriptional regulator [Rhodococcus coprophilus]MBM7457796.1 AcrR family transcriptional regulator [Rhodococcus coprophilus]